MVAFEVITALLAMLLYEISDTPERIPDPFHLPMRWISEWVIHPTLLTIPLVLLLGFIRVILKIILKSINWTQGDKIPIWVRWTASVVFTLWVIDLIVSIAHCGISEGMKSYTDSLLWIPGRYPWTYWFVLPSEAIILLRMKNEQGMWLRPQRYVEFLIRIVEWPIKK